MQQQPRDPVVRPFNRVVFHPRGLALALVGPDGLYIEHADPRILISVALVEKVRRGEHAPDVTLDGDLLKIRGVNRTVIYRLRNAPHLTAYQAEWPD